MITSVFKYAYPNAKVRAMKGVLLSEDNYHSLLNTETFEEVLHVLQTTSYSEALAEIDLTEISILVLTKIVYKSLFRDYEKTIRSVSRDIRDFFILLYQKYELINLKTILRGICSNVDPQQVAPLLLPTERYTLFSKEKLLEFRDVHDVVKHLQGTFFQYPLNLALRRFEEEQEFFPLEMALDLHYYHTLWGSIEKLPEGEKHIAKQIFGMLIDILNVAWIIRFKEQYHFSPEEILNYTIQHGHAFTLRDRRRLSEAENPGEVITYLKNTQYKKALNGDEPLNTLHVVLSQYLIAQLRKFFSGNPFQIGVILGYILLKEFEISDIITIAEAKKYGFSLEQSQHYVIHGKHDM
jgi:V/A-type H+-transporting ATPase subunit C